MSGGTMLHVDPVRVDATPGHRTSALVSIHNRGDAPATALVHTVGLGPGWSAPPFTTAPIEPGARLDVEIEIDISAGFPPCEHLAGVEVEGFDTATGASLGTAFADLVLVIGDGAQIQAVLEPADVVGGGRARFLVSLRNRSRQALRVRIEGSSPSPQLDVGFAEDAPTLPPGQTIKIEGRIRSNRPLFGARHRVPFFVKVQGRTTPVTLDGSYTQRPVLSGTGMKVLAILAVVALWGSLLVVGLGRLGARDEGNTNAAAKAAAAGANGNGNGNGSDSGNSNGTGTGDNGNGNGSGDQGSTNAPSEVKIGGKVKSKDPAGVTVTLEPTSLVDENAQGATFQEGSTPTNALGMHYGHRSADTPSLVAPTKTTTTDADGAWAFAAVHAPGYYLLTFSKNGYATRKFVVTAPDDGTPVNLEADLEPGDGSLGGTVTDANGAPLGGVDLSISDGTNTVTTATPTTGEVGNWGVQGLTTPGTYLITASRRGFGTETQLVDLGAGDSKGDVGIQMHAGVGTISGLVTDGSSSAPTDAGAKGVTVSVTSGDLVRTVTTATVGQAGSFAVPQLPLPGSYTVTVTGAGFLPSTQRVDLDPADHQNANLAIVLTRSTGSVTGKVTDDTSVGLDNVGITIANETVKLKTTSATALDGTFVQNEVPPGHYVVTYEKTGYITQSAEIDVVAGASTEVPTIALPTAPPPSTTEVGTVTISVRDIADSSLLGDTDNVTVTYTDDNHPTPQSPASLSGGVAIFNGVDPGIATFTAKADHFAPGTAQVKVLPNLSVDSTMFLVHNAVVSGSVNDGSGTHITGQPVTTSCPNDDGSARNAGVCVIATLRANTTVKRRVVADPSTGGYIFDGTLDPGIWDLTAVAAGFITNDPIGVNVVAGKTITQDIVLHSYGRIQADVQTPNSTDGSLIHFDGATVSLYLGSACSGTPIATGSTANRAPVLFANLPSTTYCLSASGTGLTLKSTLNVSTTVDTTSSVTLLLLAQSSPAKAVLHGRVVYDANGTPTPLANAHITVTGISYPVNSNPPPPYNTIRSTTASVTSGSDGTFTVDTTGFDFALGDVHVSPDSTTTQFVDQTFVNHTIWGPSSGNYDFTVQPLPGRVVGSGPCAAAPCAAKISYDPSTATDDKTQVAITMTSPANTGVSFTVDSNGIIGVRDSRLTTPTTNGILPGTYTISYTRAGFVSVPSRTFTVAPGGTVNLDQTLEKLGSLAVTVECSFTDNAGTTTTSTPDRARVTLSRTSNFTSQTLFGDKDANGNLVVNFPDLRATTTTASDGQYSIDVAAAGCQATSQSFDISTGEAHDETATLGKLGSIKGKVLGKINANSRSTTPVVGATIQTSRNGKDFSAVTGPDGSFTLTGTLGNTSADDVEGLDATDPTNSSDVYNLTVTDQDYSSPATGPTATVSAGQDTTVADIILIKKSASISGSVREDTTTGPLLTNASVVATSAEAGRTVGPIAITTGNYTLSGLEPVGWTLNFSAPNHGPVSLTVNLTPNSSATVNAVLPQRSNTITGSVQSTFGDTAQAEAGVTITVTRTDVNPPTQVGTTTTADGTDVTHPKGSFSVGQLPDGSYKVSYSKTGFNGGADDQFALSNGQVFQLNHTVTAIPAKVTLNLKTAVGSSNISGSTFTLTPGSGQRGTTQTSPATDASGNAVLPQVYPSTYTVTVTHSNANTPQHLTTLDTTTLTVAFGGADQSANFVVQEARLHGTVKTQDTASPASAEASYGVKIFNGNVSDTSGTADFTATTGSDGVYDIYVPGRSDGYTLRFFLDSNHSSDTSVHVSAANGANVTTDYTFVKFASIDVTVTPKAGSTYTIQLDSGTPVAGTSHSFTGLTPGTDYTITVEETTTTSGGGSTTTTVITHRSKNSTVTAVPGSNPVTFDFST